MFAQIGNSNGVGGLEKAREEYEASRRIAARLLEAKPGDHWAERQLSVAYNKLGDVSQQAGQLDEARKYDEKGLAIAETLAKADPSDAVAQRDVSISYNKLGDISQRAGQLDAARKYSQQGLTIAEKQAAADPNNAEAQRDLFVSLFRLGATDSAAHRYVTAAGSFEKAVGVLDKMREQGRHVADSEWQECTKTLHNARLFAGLIGQKELLAQLPPEYQSVGLAVRAWGLAVTGELNDAAAAAELLRNLRPRTADNLYNVAKAYSLCAAHLDPKASKTATQRRNFTDLALGALGQAVDNGLRDTDQMLRDPDLAALRGLPPFTALIARKAAGRLAHRRPLDLRDDSV